MGVYIVFVNTGAIELPLDHSIGWRSPESTTEKCGCAMLCIRTCAKTWCSHFSDNVLCANEDQFLRFAPAKIVTINHVTWSKG